MSFVVQGSWVNTHGGVLMVKDTQGERGRVQRF
jgi:hypothetical protein